ncbi:arabinogalactan oligomer / maltooligosaccharide transport system permease protein [Paenibacillus sophorae]|uniref:Arabinogalactan oligomer / maltooligosaccharide transport system permease protein n=2 Tax=Paenibacillus sophorae TaxID=1333845 RepID=A0A1H8UXZ5_9BACL|nr:sugar ABC transporter permease [Paenibacillus sophorae]SEP08092.1 arabinogalactan oligomer / maltooligosaccharide transport system permease protein [Paenibacillus sophorae]
MEKRSIIELRRPFLSGCRTSAVLSVLVMGAGQLNNRQYGKGIALMLLHLAGLYVAIAKLPHAVWALVTLGETSARLEKVGKVYQQVIGDHSIYLLVEGLIMIFLMFLLLAVYVLNIRDAYRCARLREEGMPLHTFRQTLHFLLDYRFPQIAIAIPVLGILFFTVMPIVFMILLAFTDFTRSHMPPAQLINWHGLETFRDIFRLRVWSETFYGVTLWTLLWAVASTLTCFAAGFVIALAVQQKDIRFKKFWRTIFILPYAIPLFVSTLILRNVFNGQFGPVNDYLELMGFGRVPWLSDPEWAKLTLVLVNMLLGFPVIMLMIIGVLSTIPGDMYEAADIDGADGLQKLRLITFPTVMYTMMPILIMQFVANINNFNVIYLLTGGNPVNGNYQFAGHTDILITWLYKLSMEQGQYNFASVIGIFIFVLLSGFAVWSIRRTKSFKEERL